jgi:hypothetical protein
MLGGRAGEVVVGLAVKAGAPIDVIAIPPDRARLQPASVRVDLNGVRLARAGSCGSSCFRYAGQVLDGTARTLAVAVRRSGRTATASFSLPPAMPASGAAVLQRARQTMRSLRTFEMDERLDSGRSVVRASFAFQAPDRMRYVMSNGARAVLVGERRWDWTAGRWAESEYQRLSVPSYPWTQARNARLVGRTRRNGKPVSVLTAFLSRDGYLSWFRLEVASDGLVLESRMAAPAHFMVDRYHSFNRSLTIEPPR